MWNANVFANNANLLNGSFQRNVERELSTNESHSFNFVPCVYPFHVQEMTNSQRAEHQLYMGNMRSRVELPTGQVTWYNHIVPQYHLILNVSFKQRFLSCSFQKARYTISTIDVYTDTAGSYGWDKMAKTRNSWGNQAQEGGGKTKLRTQVNTRITKNIKRNTDAHRLVYTSLCSKKSNTLGLRLCGLCKDYLSSQSDNTTKTP